MENPTSGSPRPSILFVEDDEEFFIIAQYALEEAGFEGTLEIAQNSEELKNFLNTEHAPDLIVLDLNAGPNDWRRCLLCLKKDNRSMRIPIVVLFAFNEPEDIELCDGYSDCSHVEKPRSLEGWKVCMKKMIQKSMGGSNSPEMDDRRTPLSAALLEPEK